MCSETCMNQHPSQGEKWWWGTQKVPQIEHLGEQPHRSVNLRALNWKRDGPPWPLQDRGVCCQWATLPSLTFWRGRTSPLFTFGFLCQAGPNQIRTLNYSSACCQLLMYLSLTVLLTSHRRESVSGQDCQLQWSLCVPFWREEQGSLIQGSLIPQRWLSALYCRSLVPLPTKTRGPATECFQACLCFVSSCCHSVFSFVIQSFSLFLLECSLFCIQYLKKRQENVSCLR